MWRKAQNFFFFNIIAIIEFEIWLFGQYYLISYIINTINHQNINIVTVLVIIYEISKYTVGADVPNLTHT